jgi:hypothetical protein
MKTDIQEMLNLNTEISIKDYDYLRMTPIQRKTITDSYFENLRAKRSRLVELRMKYDL